MPPRFQFKLKTLLASVAFVCFALGVYHLFWQPYVNIESPAVERFSVRCRFPRFGWADYVPIELRVVASHGEAEVVYKEVGGAAHHLGWGRYYVNCHFSLRAPAGTYHVVVTPAGSSELHATLIVPESTASNRN